MKTILIAGNGKSRLNYDLNKIKRDLNVPLYVCNLAYINLDYDRVFAIDDQVKLYLEEDQITYTRVSIEDEYEPIEYRGSLIRPRNNAGMVAMKFAINEGYTNLNLYGFDSLVSDDENEIMSNIFENEPAYTEETRCSYVDSVSRKRYFIWFKNKYSNVTFNFYR